MKTKHTPTPWKLIRPLAFGIDGMETSLGDAVCARFTDEQCEDNAEFIVRAVNSHETLLEAAKKALAYIDQLPLSKTTGDLLPPFGELKQAIAQAEGK